MNDIKFIVAKNITQLRQEKKMTQLELAEQLNYSDKAVSKWEHADSMPDIATLVEIANIFGVTLDYLVEEEHKKPVVKEKKEPQFNHGIIMAVSVALCYMVPGWRLKLEAPAMVYFAASLRHMALLKGLAAMAAALVAATVPYWDDLREPLPEEL